MDRAELEPAGGATSDAEDGPTLDALLRCMAELEASDLHLKPKRPPLIRHSGRLVPLPDMPVLEPAWLASMLAAVVPARMRETLETRRSVAFGYGLPGVARFRVAVFYQRGTVGAVLRRVPFEFPGLEAWGLPEVLGELCHLPQGLVLVTGPTGSGKSSTLAALLRRIAETRAVHIVTIEDPIEYLISDRVASVTQREVGTDTPAVSDALYDALRQDPDVLMVGETRDEETMRTVLAAAETGHLVLSTLHTNSADQTVDRVLSMAPEAAHGQVRRQLAEMLEAVVSMQLVPRADGGGLIAAVEIMRKTPRVSKLILEGDLMSLREEIASSVSFHKMQTMNQSLAALVLHGAVTARAAMDVSPAPDELDLLLRTLAGAAEGDAMVESLSDFSRITELQEIRKAHDELQERFAREIRSRDMEIETLRGQVAELGDRSSEEAALEAVRADNERLAKQIEICRSDYEAKVERLNARIRELSGQAKAADGERRGLFRR